MRSVVTDDEPLVVSDFRRLVDRRFAAVEQQETAGRRRGGRGSRDEVEPGTVVVSKTVGATGRHVRGVRDRRSAWNAAVGVFDKRRAAANCADRSGPYAVELLRAVTFCTEIERVKRILLVDLGHSVAFCSASNGDGSSTVHCIVLYIFV